MAMTETTPNAEPWVPDDTFGARLALIRQRLHLNVKQAAELCELNYQSWHNWEHGSLPRDVYETAEKIAGATGCSQRWLLLGGNLPPEVDGPDLHLVHGEDPNQGELPFYPPDLRLVPS